MLNLIICDDDQFTLHLVTSLIKNAIKKSRTEARISCIASSGSEVIRFIKNSPGTYLYFLDFDFGKEELNGIDLVKQIYQWDKNGKIVFVTSHSEKGMDILRSGIRAFGFIDKTPDQKKMIDEYVKYLNMAVTREDTQEISESASPLIQLPLGIDEMVELPVSEIVYVDSVKAVAHSICYHTFDGSEITVRDTIEHVLSMLGEGFIRCHRSVLVSQKHVVSLKNGMIKLSNGESVTCAMGKRKEVAALCFANGGTEK